MQIILAVLLRGEGVGAPDVLIAGMMDVSPCSRLHRVIPSTRVGLLSLCLIHLMLPIAMVAKTSIAELIAEDERSPMPASDFDDSLWKLLAEQIISVEEAEVRPRPVALYFASRYVQWDVGNGGFAQAAYNIPEWFGLAAEGYQALGKESSAQLIREAIKLLPDEQAELVRSGLFAATISRVFEHFKSSRLAALDVRIVDADWYVDAERVEYVRRNRDQFKDIA